MTIKASCDRCDGAIKINTWRGANVGYQQYALFTLLGKERNYTLCEKCEKLFLEWAGIDR